MNKEIKIETQTDLSLGEAKITINADGHLDMLIDGKWNTSLSREQLEDVAELIKKALEYKN